VLEGFVAHADIDVFLNFGNVLIVGALKLILRFLGLELLSDVGYSSGRPPGRRGSAKR